jgi:hypothetical protein
VVKATYSGEGELIPIREVQWWVVQDKSDRALLCSDAEDEPATMAGSDSKSCVPLLICERDHKQGRI